MSALFLELAKTVLFLSSSHLTFRLRMISSMVVLAPHGEVAKALPVVSLARHNLLVSVGAVVGLGLLATTLADKNMGTVLYKFFLIYFVRKDYRYYLVFNLFGNFLLCHDAVKSTFSFFKRFGA